MVHIDQCEDTTDPSGIHGLLIRMERRRSCVQCKVQDVDPLPAFLETNSRAGLHETLRPELGSDSQITLHTIYYIEAGDMKTFSFLVLAIAEGNDRNFRTAQEDLQHAIASWPGDLQNENDFRVEAPEGVIWFETGRELHDLKKEAEELISSQNP